MFRNRCTARMVEFRNVITDVIIYKHAVQSLPLLDNLANCHDVPIQGSQPIGEARPVLVCARYVGKLTTRTQHRCDHKTHAENVPILLPPFSKKIRPFFVVVR